MPTMSKVIVHRLWLGIFALCAWGSPQATVQAAPLVSGLDNSAISHGQLVVISGTGFDVRGSYNSAGHQWQSQTYLPAAFKDFEDGSVTSQGFAGNFMADIAVKIGGPLNSTRYESAFYNGSRLANYGVRQTGNNTRSVFSSFWFMFPAGTEGGKPWRWYFGSNSSSDNLYLGKQCGKNTLNLGGDFTGTTAYGTGTISEGVWHKLEVYASEADGSYRLWIDGALYLDWAAAKGTSVWNIAHNALTPDGHSVETPNMIDGTVAGCATTGSYNYDDIYIDYTQARVELCEGATWATRGLCNTQIPTNWSAGAITIAVNRGTFSAGTSKYLYVIDAAGIASNPFRVTFTENGLRPASPKNVNAQ